MNGVMAIATIVAVVYAARSFVADHNRRRKQATMERLAGVRSEYREKVLQLRGPGAGPITDEEAREIEADPERRKQVEDLLSLFEHLATGVNCDVYDLAVLNRLSGQYFIDVFDTYERYMARVRENEKQKGRRTRYWQEFYIMVNNIRRLRHMRPVTLP